VAAGNGVQRSDRIKQRGNPVTSLRYVPGCQSQNAVVIFILFLKKGISDRFWRGVFTVFGQVIFDRRYNRHNPLNLAYFHTDSYLFYPVSPVFADFLD